MCQQKVKTFVQESYFTKIYEGQTDVNQNKYNSSTLYTVTWGMSYVSAGQGHIGSYIVKDVCVHNPENINNLEQEAFTVWCCYCSNMGLYWLTFVI